MIRQLRIYLVSCDEPVMHIGPGCPLSWPELKHVVDSRCSLLWEMHGEGRILPLWILTDLLRSSEAIRNLVRLGRSTQIKLHPLTFTWAQAVPLTQLLPECLNNDGTISQQDTTHDSDHG